MTTLRPDVTFDDIPLLVRGEHVFDQSQFAPDFATFSHEDRYKWPDHAAVRLHPDTYQITERGHLWVRRITSSGRDTIFPIGTDATARMAANLVLAMNERDAITFEELLSLLPLPSDSLRQLLSLLFMFDIVSPMDAP